MIEEDTGTRPDPSPPTASLCEAFQTCANDVQRFPAGKVSREATAADLAQETYLRVVRSDPTLSVADPRSYLFRIANNLAIDHLRSQRRRRLLFPSSIQRQTTAKLRFCSRIRHSARRSLLSRNLFLSCAAREGDFPTSPRPGTVPRLGFPLLVRHPCSGRTPNFPENRHGPCSPGRLSSA
ncbi:MAG: hypothetical protein E6R14_10085 [Thermomicrobiales bacterium]|nr:MAG: hypothetical protein E6R14_10085 [Thermomicrobiales bacterium]